MLALGMCFPLDVASYKFGEALSDFFMTVRSLWLTFVFSAAIAPVQPAASNKIANAAEAPT
jgi:hypothetical protein